ncbi:hypothetical protein [Pararhodobacter zhoushanensis]|uniref:Uncharacterized protein n=1 Tax=Pararhodobacter zhoushanensis TaxID=2479545 RepID=A0ABT3H099_9RHOB|nr:hypothetical protein [Pararhodobacter zhoushanensis]MCW1933236.1 hypothetical protein [Pararhodobacter zhoushanensis]
MPRIASLSTLALIAVALTGSMASATTIITTSNTTPLAMTAMESDGLGSARATMRHTLRHRSATGGNVTIISSTEPVIVTRREGLFSGFFAFLSPLFGGYHRDAPTHHADVEPLVAHRGSALMQADTHDDRANSLMSTLTRRLSR